METAGASADGAANDESVLDDLIARYLEGVDTGKTISVDSLDGLRPEMRERLLRFVELAGDFAELAAAQQGREDALSRSEDYCDRAGCDFGDFRVQRTLGIGGMGVVYLAKHRETGQLAAVKVLRQSIAQRRVASERFRREVQAIASLTHPNIVPLVSSGIELDSAFLGMKLIDGVTLAEIIASAKVEPEGSCVDAETDASTVARTPVTAVSVAACAALLLRNGNYFVGIAALAATIADALSAAHCAGIVHRDVKPSNILLDAQGKAWLTDFGLASFSDDQTALTMTGEIVGTPAYMSPEQTMGPNQRVDERCDIYSLGATLFHLATLEKPFHGNPHQILFRVMRGDVAAPRAIRPEVPAELEAIILKAMALSPASRYSTASEMAEDLRRFATGKLVYAKRPGLTERTYRWVESNPLVAFASLLGLFATIIAVFTVQAVNSRSLRRMNRALESVNEFLSQSNDALTTREQQLRQQLYVSDVSAAFKAYDEGDFPRVRELLQRHRSASDASDMRGFAWHLLDGLSRAPDVIELTRHEGPSTELAVFPGGRKAVSVGHDGQIHLFDLQPGAVVQSIAVGEHLDSIAVSSDGKSILTAMNVPVGTNSTRRYDVESGELLTSWPGHSSSVDSASVSPDGLLYATADRYNEIQVRRANGDLVQRITTDSRNESLAFFNSNATVAAIFRDPDGFDSLKLFDLADGQKTDLNFDFEPKTFACSPSHPTESTFSVVAAGTDKIGVVQWPGSETILDEQEIVGRIRCVDISPDGQIAVAGCDEGSVFIWRLTNLQDRQPTQPPQVIYASEQRITSVKVVVAPTQSDARSPSEALGILTASDDGRVRLWPLPPDNPRPLFRSAKLGLESFVSHCKVPSPDEDTICMRFGDGSIGILDSSLEFRRISSPPTDKLEKVFLTPSGKRVLVATPSHLVSINLESGLVDHRVEKHDADQNCADILAVGGELYVLFNDHIMVVDPDTLKALRIVHLPDDNAKRLVRVPGTQSIRVVTRLNIHELSRGELTTVATSPSTAENYSDIAYSESGDRIAICYLNGSIRVESRDGLTPPVLLLGHRKRILNCVFLDNGRTLATTANDRTIRFWNLATGRELGALNLANSAANSFHYFPNSGKLVTTHYKDPPQIWTLSPRD